jgi:hypothetical protein
MKQLVRVLLSFSFLAAGAAQAAERPHLVQPDNLSKYWLVSSTGDPMAPSYGKNLTAPTCAAVSYEIERGGATSHVKLEKIVPEGDLAGVATSIVSNLHYAAAQQNIGRDPVYTYVILPFNAPDVTKGPSATAEKRRLVYQCKLDNFKLPEGM